MTFIRKKPYIYLLLIFNFFLLKNAIALDSLSYSGRLVQTNGAPVVGPVDLKAELVYTNNLSTVLCSDDISSVALSKGVFHVKLDFSCTGGKTLTEVLTQAPAGESVAIQITDVTNSKTYSYQAIHALPYANVASQLVQMAATNGQVLQWSTANKKWEPGTITLSGGTVTNVTASSPLSVSNASSTPAISISQANGTTSGYLSSADWNTFNNKQGALPTGGTTAQFLRGDSSWQTLDTNVVPENVNLYFTNARVLGVPLTGLTTSTGAIVATDTVLEAFGKVQGQINSANSDSANFLVKNGTDSITGVINVGTIGLLQLAYTPTNLTDATNKSYVDSQVGTKVSKSGDTMSGVLTLDNDLKIKGGSNYVTIKGHASSAVYNLFLPQTAGTSGYLLSTDGSGNTSWVTPIIASSNITDGSIVDADVNASAAISQSKISGLTTSLSGKEPSITVGTAAQYWKGDKTWSSLQTDTQALVMNNYAIGANTSIANTDSLSGALGKVQGQINATNTAVSGKEPTISAGTATQYWRGDKAWSTFATDAINSVLSTFALGVGTKPAVTSSDSIVGAFGKVQKTLNDINADYVSKSADQTINGSLAINSLTGFITVPTPINPTDAANKGYVDGFGQWLKSGSNIYFNTGNVGIGFTNPTTKLAVNAATNGGPAGLFIDAKTRQIGETNVPLLQIDSGIAGGNATSLWVNSSGNIGINNTTPTRKLDVVGQGSFETNSAVVLNIKGLGAGYADSTNGVMTVYSENTVGSGGNVIKADSAFATNTLVVKDNGRVGIGTANPSSKLHVTSSAANTMIRVESTAGSGQAEYYSTANGTSWVLGTGAGNAGSTNLGFYNAGNKMVLTTAGNLGIGIETPDYPLTVNGTIGVGYDKPAGTLGLGNMLVFRGVENSTDTMYIAKYVASSDVSALRVNIGDEGSDYFVVGSSGGGVFGDRFWIKSDGNGWMAGSLAQASDRRLKKNIVPINNSLERLLSLDGVYYDWISKEADKTKQIGLIAQEVQKVFPEVVRKNEEGFLSVSYANLIAPVIESIKEIYNNHIVKLWNDQKRQDREIASIKEENKKLKEENEMIKSYLCQKDKNASFCSKK